MKEDGEYFHTSVDDELRRAVHNRPEPDTAPPTEREVAEACAELSGKLLKKNAALQHRVEELEIENRERMRQLYVISWHVRTNGQGGIGSGDRSREARHLISEYYEHGPYLDVPSEDEVSP